MSKTVYVGLIEITPTQASIMRFVDDWVRQKKTPVPRSKIMAQMILEGIVAPTVIKSLESLLELGYIRKGIVISNKTYYVQLRRI